MRWESQLFYSIFFLELFYFTILELFSSIFLLPNLGRVFFLFSCFMVAHCDNPWTWSPWAIDEHYLKCNDKPKGEFKYNSSLTQHLTSNSLQIWTVNCISNSFFYIQNRNNCLFVFVFFSHLELLNFSIFFQVFVYSDSWDCSFITDHYDNMKFLA